MPQRDGDGRKVEGNYNEVVMSINDHFRTLKRQLINMFYGCEKKSMEKNKIKFEHTIYSSRM